MEAKRIFVAGHRGMVGSAIARKLRERGDIVVTRSRSELNLVSQAEVQMFFSSNQFDEVYLAAAKVGGIHANSVYPAEFIYENIMIQANIVQSAFSSGVKKLLALGSSCIYPRLAPQPMSEDALLTGILESSNEPYAIAKIAGIKLCESYNRQYGESHGIDFRCVMPTNLYGPGDNYHPENSHVIPGLIRRFHDAKKTGAESVKIWGTGTPRREFLYVDDMASASIHVMDIEPDIYRAHTTPMLSHINVGVGTDVSIFELACLIKNVVGYQGIIETDSSKPDGTPQKLLDVSRISSLGWQASTNLHDGLTLAYKDFLSKFN